MVESAIDQATESSPSRGYRFCISIGALGSGGIGPVMLKLAENLLKWGNEVDLLFTSRNHMGREKEIPLGVELFQASSRSRYGLPKTIRYLRARRPDFVLTAHHHVDLLMLVAHRLSGLGKRCRVACTFHTHHSTHYSLNSSKIHWFKRLNLWCVFKGYRYTDSLIAVSKGVAEDMERVVGLSKGTIKVIYNPAWSDKMETKAQEECEDPWLLNKKFPVLMGIGRLTRQKDFPTLIRAFAKVRATVGAKLIILGEGEDREPLQALIDQLQLSEHVRMPGHVANPFSMLARSDVFVLSSAWEGFGNVLVEAMGCGVPVVSTNCLSGPDEVLEGGKYGRLVEVGDHVKLAGEILNELENPTPRPILKTRAEDFSAPKIAKEYFDFLVRDRER